MGVSGRYGGGGSLRPLDVTLVRHADVVPWRYPPTRAFAYGEWLRAAYEMGACPAPGPHPDVAIALAQARATGEFVPKAAAAAWATARLPRGQGVWLELAGRAYVGACADDWSGQEGVVVELAVRLRLEVEGACGAW